MTSIAIVVPTIGRASLHTLLDSLSRSVREPFDELIVVDDRSFDTRAARAAQDDTTRAARAAQDSRIDMRAAQPIARRLEVLRSGGRGPAAARNVGWRAATSEWICFLDDDVEVSEDWAPSLHRDLAADGVAGSQGRVEVPLPRDRAPTDWERNVAGLERAAWITADMAYRRDALETAGGFDERFPRAYREDADLALRVQSGGGHLERGARRALHPVRRADRWISVRLQRGNADDVLMRALHGRNWRARCGESGGRFALHAAVVASSLLWAGLVARFAYTRIAPGPRTVDEIATMLLTSAVIPYAAVYHRLRGAVRWRRFA